MGLGLPQMQGIYQVFWHPPVLRSHLLAHYWMFLYLYCTLLTETNLMGHVQLIYI